jgi:hypothetical protein
MRFTYPIGPIECRLSLPGRSYTFNLTVAMAEGESLEVTSQHCVAVLEGLPQDWPLGHVQSCEITHYGPAPARLFFDLGNKLFFFRASSERYPGFGRPCF